ncbi:hypothetical protein H7C18_34675, partial [Cohnella sp. CBP 2801]|nr:hypothetical protein [Cohnella zeiphila]
MSLNVGSMMRALLGDGQPADGRSLELKIGQIVRGVLLGMLENNEALFQIGGVQVRAKVETELPVGKGTLLQVQPESKAGLIVLKPLADATDPPSGEALADLAKSFGMPDQKWSLELLRGLKRDGYPIDKATADWFKQAAEAKPDGADAQEWMSAASVAFRRGLAPTETTVASLRQALYGPPLTDQLRQLQTLLADYSEPAQPDSASAALARRAGELLAQGDALLSQAGELLASPPEEGGATAGQPRTAAASSAAAETGLPGRPEEAAARTNGGEAGPAAPAANGGAAPRGGGALNAPALPLRAPADAAARAA